MNFTDIQLGSVTVTTEQNPVNEVEIEKEGEFVNIKAFTKLPSTVAELEQMVDNLVAKQSCEDK